MTAHEKTEKNSRTSSTSWTTGLPCRINVKKFIGYSISKSSIWLPESQMISRGGTRLEKEMQPAFPEA
jgi:hypothetical protein